MSLIGVPKEIKNHEYRVGLTPSSVKELTGRLHDVIVEKGAGLGSGFADAEYQAAGAKIVQSAIEVFERADFIVKVKEPQEVECQRLRKGQVLFTYLHLAPDPLQATLLQESGAIAIAYETVTDHRGHLPLLAPMSKVAGKMSIQAGAHCLEKAAGGRGVLLGGVPGVAAGDVVIIGGGVVGSNAIQVALGMGANVVVLDQSIDRLQELANQFGPRLRTIYSTRDAIEHYVTQADLVVGAVLVPGAAAPKLISRDILQKMRPQSVFVDVAIDQGGCAETSHATTHLDPTYVVNGVVHYCVANMPGALSRTSTQALNNATLPFVLKLADKGYRLALQEDVHLRNGLNVCEGHITCDPVAKALGRAYVSAEDLLK